MKNKNVIYVILTIVFSLLTLTCKKDPVVPEGEYVYVDGELVQLPTVTTKDVYGVTNSTATCGGVVTKNGGSFVTARGVCWSTSQNPEVSGWHTSDDAGNGEYTSYLSGLLANTTYYVRAYATNAAGTAYGAQKSFTTSTAGEKPTVVTYNATNITNTTAVLNGRVTDQGGSYVSLRGFCWSTSSNPTLENCLGQTSVGNGTGDFSYNLSGLSTGTTYYVRAWAKNSAGTAYGQTRSFQTVNDEVAAQVIQEILSSMVYVEGGTFQMGATSEQGSDAFSDESPVHQVTVSSFYMGKTEVTQRQWKAIMGSNPSYFTGDNRPVENVSWNDCQAFIQKLNQLTGRTFRLPTEAEWEYAARGGKYHSGYKYSGSNEVGYVAWYEGNSGSQTHDVKTKQPNALGLYDMSGNVWEWCSDWYGSYGSGAQTNPQGPSSGSYRVLRGGSWYSYARYCRVSYRSDDYPDDRYNSFGFRLSIVQ